MIGNFFLSLAFVAILLSSLFYFISFYKKDEKASQIGRIFFHLFSIFFIAASGLFLNLILSHQFKYKYVYSYSSTDLPLGLLLSTFYAGQEGSFLLWILWMTLIGLFLDYYFQKRKEFESSSMANYAAIILLLVSISLFAKNPFKLTYEEETYLPIRHINSSMYNSEIFAHNLLYDQKSGEAYFKLDRNLYEILKNKRINLSSFIVEGRGLNPLLQNFWMQIHPPVLFIGFALGGVLFAFALSFLMRNDYKNMPTILLPWSSFFVGILGLGLILGGYWSYGTLGWGGYWGWDPVENSSLVPWLIGVALIHFLLLQKKSLTEKEAANGSYVKTNLWLAGFAFISILYSTLLTRSGILADASVHSFSSPEGYGIYFLSAAGIIFLLWFSILFLKRRKYLSSTNIENFSYLSRELALLTASIFVLFSALTVILGTSSPIFGISTEVEYYKKLNLPIAIILAFLNGFSLILKWKTNDKKETLKQTFFYSIISAIITVVFSLVSKVSSINLILLIFVTSFALIINVEKTYKSIKKGILKPGAFIAHLGFAIILFGIASTTGFELKETKELLKNKPESIFDKTFKFKEAKLSEDGKKYYFEIELIDGDKKEIIAPIMYYSEYNKSVMKEPYIAESFLYDLYIVPLYYETRKDETYKTYELKKGEQAKYDNYDLLFEGFEFSKDARENMNSGKDFEIGIAIKVTDANKKEYTAKPAFVSQNGKTFYKEYVIEDLNLKFEILQMNASGKIDLAVSLRDKTYDNVFAIEASIKPFVSLIWIGSVVSFLGLMISFVRRIKES